MIPTSNSDSRATIYDNSSGKGLSADAASESGECNQEQSSLHGAANGVNESDFGNFVLGGARLYLGRL